MGLLNKLAGLFTAKEETTVTVKPNRNESCWCGSGKKYKKCHLPEDESKAAQAKACSLNCGPT
jgi:hypothetical protein